MYAALQNNYIATIDNGILLSQSISICSNGINGITVLKSGGNVIYACFSVYNIKDDRGTYVRDLSFLPQYIASDADENVYVVNSNTNKVIKFFRVYNSTVVFGLPLSNSIGGIAIGGGKLFIIDKGSNSVIVSWDDQTYNTSSFSKTPRAITANSQGDAYVTFVGDSSVAKLTLNWK
jgi:DNA-binding beta-propeller fold protein YncE